MEGRREEGGREGGREGGWVGAGRGDAVVMKGPKTKPYTSGSIFIPPVILSVSLTTSDVTLVLDR